VTVRFRPGTAQGAGNIAMVAVMSGATSRRVGPISASRLTAWSLCAARPSVRPGRGRRLLDYAALRSGLPGAESRLCTTFEATGPRRGAGVTRGVRASASGQAQCGIRPAEALARKTQFRNVVWMGVARISG
jgi:hypothetical protein